MKEIQSNETIKMQPRVSERQLHYLKEIVKVGMFGNTPTAVCLFFIQNGIREAIADGYIAYESKHPLENGE